MSHPSKVINVQYIWLLQKNAGGKQLLPALGPPDGGGVAPQEVVLDQAPDKPQAEMKGEGQGKVEPDEQLNEKKWVSFLISYSVMSAFLVVSLV